ncbi:serine/threonine-protein kinase [Rhodobacter capsulatus]|jgi:serine/threonine protein kinase|uniref:Serine/threonine-protein kinase n=1 Tax=Rhodobacter capsulatus (strain ATCC BAA-309 / NBRC 16581 / SB1003) TaxID=272942 RepID=D5AT53_RHOCB|nr:serine/threonine-protein kinase [Rhodobacter capsulatus]ADE85160.1 serine/threonine-protein kinase [Rhodobacter capsulatus SB 1003]MDS0926815.1 serine/threonine protein kinase [Rhodobacter capsulatus]TQD34619.1 serine/threonine protein kinase [Rhodobacter capsulatus]
MDLIVAGADAPLFDHFHLKHLQSVKAEGGNFYRNQKFLGKGGNGTAFLVTCTSGANQGIQFALKVFHKISDEKRRSRFLGEIRHYRSLNHPALLKVYDEGTYVSGDREYPFAVIDYVPRNLESMIGRGGAPQISRLEAVRYVYNIASAVNYLHAQPQPIVHRDIKPANILVDGHSAKLGDLGLAKVLLGEHDEMTEEFNAYAAMPYFYRTPELVEIARGKNIALSPASDVYQLGLVLYRCVTGFNPQKPPVSNIKEEIELDVRPVIGAASELLNELFGWIFQSDPTKRPNTLQLLQRLNQIHTEVCAADLAATGVMR